MGGAFQDKTNERFGSLVAIRWEKREDCTWWFCKCDCGNTKWVRGKHLDNGTKKVKVISCGCSKSKPRSHGLSKTTEHKIWLGMRKRCYNPKAVGYCYYGAKGIKVCKRWSGKNGFQNFLADMGKRPGKNYSIDRIDNNGNYCPSNCRWTTRKVQARSRIKVNSVLVTLEGKTKSVSQWSRILKVNKHTIYRRLKSGRSSEDAVRKDDLRADIVGKHRILTYQGVTLNVWQWSKKLGIEASVIYHRIRKGLPTEQILSKYDLRSGRDISIPTNQ